MNLNKKLFFSARISIIGLVLGLLMSPLVAQTIKVKSLGVNEGLSDAAVKDIHTDRYGYKWISTGHGLNKYDGHSFKTFRYNPNDTLSIRANSLGRIFEDKHGNIWVLVDIGGISKFDRVTKTFCYFTYSSTEQGHNNNFVLSAHFDSQDRGWIATRVGINLLNKDRLRYEPVGIEGHDEAFVTGIFEDSNQKVWIGTNKGLFQYNEKLLRFEEIKSSKDESIVGISRWREDRNGGLWFSSFRYGLYRTSLKESPKIQKIELPEKGESFITSIMQTNDSELMVVLMGKGIFEYHKTGWKSITLQGFKKESLRFAYSTKENNRIFILTNENQVFLYNSTLGTTLHVSGFNQPINGFSLDKDDKNIWLGSMNFGLYQVSVEDSDFDVLYANEDRVDDHDYSNLITDLLASQNGKIYMAVHSGIIEYDEKTEEKCHVLTYQNHGGRFPHFINSIKEINAQNLALGTQKGIYKFNVQSRTAKTLLDIEERVSDFTIQNDSLWAIGNFGLLVHSISNDTTTFFRDIEKSPEVLKQSMARKLFVDKSGVIWVGTVREGLFRVEPSATDFQIDRYMYPGARTSGFLSQSINAIYEDKADRLWIGGFSTGLLEFDRQNRKFINYTLPGTLPIPNVQAIEEAEDGCIWLSAADGIHKFVYSDKSFKRYTTENGLSSNSFILRSSTRTPEGKILFGSNSGITIFDPMEISKEPEFPSVTLENIKVFNTNQSYEKPTYEIDSISLKHNENFLTLDFTALNFNKADLITYAYQLEGLNEEWTNIGSNRTINLNNLRPGEYKLKIKAALNDGNWGDLRILNIFIRPPFWLKPWFFLAMVALILAILWSIHYYRLQLKVRRLSFMEDIRKKAAADFHDEMGNKLTRIALFTDVLKKKLNGTTPEISEYVEKIRDNSRNLNSSMRDFLWALDPKKDSAHDVAILLKDFGEELFDKTEIDFNVECIDSNLQRYKLDMDWKRNLIMVFKEAMHNVLKHAEATRASLSFQLTEDKFEVLLSDNGSGISPTQKTDGYGLRNMTYRTKELGGELIIEPIKQGTMVKFIGNLKSFSLA